MKSLVNKHERGFIPYISRHNFEGQNALIRNCNPHSAKLNYLEQMRRQSLQDLEFTPVERVLQKGEKKLLHFEEIPGELGLLVKTYAKYLVLKLSIKAPYVTPSIILEQKRCCNFIVSILSLLENITFETFQIQHLWHFAKLQQNENLCRIINYTRQHFQRTLDRAIDFGDFLLYCIPNEQNLVPILLEFENKFLVKEKDIIIRLGESVTESLGLLIRVCLSNWVIYFDHSIQSSFIFYYQIEDFDPEEEFVFSGPKHDPIFDEITNSLSKYLHSPISGIVEDGSGIIINLVFIYIKNIIHSLKPKPRRKVPFKTGYFNNLPKFFDFETDFISRTWGNLPFLYFSLSKFLDFLAFSKLSINLNLDFRTLCKRVQVKLADQRFSYEKICFVNDFYKWPK